VQKSFQQQLTYLTPEGEDARSDQSRYTTEMVAALFEEIESSPAERKKYLNSII